MSSVSVVVLRTVKPGREAAYEAWLARAKAAASAFPGHLGADVVRQGAHSVTRTEGLEAWFTLPGPGMAVPPPRAKMALVSWAVSFPLIVLLSAALGPLLAPFPQVAKVAVVSAVMVLAMTYVVMPAVTRALVSWLYPRR